MPGTGELMKHIELTAIAVAFAAIAPNGAHAADSTLDPIVVTATRQPTRANELLADVSVIEREEIEAAGQSTLTELLGRQPGIQFSSNGGPGSTSSLYVRGTNAEHIVVLVDGIRVNSATLGSTSFSRMPLSQIDHIEILRGPASALYGADAIGGVIQIFTRKGDGGGAKFNAEAGYGTYGTSQLTAGVSGSHQDLQYSLQVSQNRTNGFSNVSDRKSKAYNPDNDGFSDASYSAKLAYRFTPDHEVGLKAFSSNGKNDYDSGFSAASARKDYRNDLTVSSYSAYSRNRFLPNWQSTLQIGQGVDDTEYKTNNVQTSAVRTIQDQYLWQNDITLPLGKALVAAEWLDQKIRATQNYTENSRTIKSLLSGWGGSLGSHRWQLNVRHDDISGTGTKNTGTAGYGYQLTDTLRAYGSWGTAYKAPSLNDLYFPNTAGVGRGNPNLKPEYAHSGEVSMLWETASQNASLTYFENQIDNLIQWTETPTGSFFYVPNNVSKAKITGWTLAYRGRVGPFNLRGSVDLQDPRDESTGNQLARRAREYGTIGAEYDIGRWSIGGELVSSGQRYSDTDNLQRMGGYTLVNLNGNYRLDKDFSLFARVNNLFDKHYELAQYYGTSGANVFVGIRYQPK